MHYELADHEWATIKPMLPNKPSSGERPSCSQQHFLGPAIWSTPARSAGCVRPLHHLRQPLRSLAAGRVWVS